MSTEETIKALRLMEHVESIVATYEPGEAGSSTTVRELKEACRVAADALNAQQAHTMDRSRWEGCEECGEDIYKCENCKYHSERCEETTLTPVIYSYCIKLNADCHDLIRGFSPGRCPCFELQNNVRFCQNCGRPLTEAAWAELERRINGGTIDN